MLYILYVYIYVYIKPCTLGGRWKSIAVVNIVDVVVVVAGVFDIMKCRQARCCE